MSVYFNQTNQTPGTPFATGGGGSNFPNGALLGVQNSGGALFGTSNMTSIYQTTQSNLTWYPATYVLQPATASLNDSLGIILRYDPLDAGQTALVLGARGDGSAFLTGVWEGFISMPMEIGGANITFVGDSGETFMFMEGKAGALGSVSVGTYLLSASNAMSSITDTSGRTANMTALFSTLQTSLPACFS
jgi:hypothetical protein